MSGQRFVQACAPTRQCPGRQQSHGCAPAPNQPAESALRRNPSGVQSRVGNPQEIARSANGTSRSEASKSAELQRILRVRKRWRREWESSKSFCHCLPISSSSFQLFRILPLGGKCDLPLFSAVYHEFRVFPFGWHSKWHSTEPFGSADAHTRRISAKLTG
jgi:hypothetical protein